MNRCGGGRFPAKECRSNFCRLTGGTSSAIEQVRLLRISELVHMVVSEAVNETQRMGCNTSSVVPLGDSDLEDKIGIQVRINPSTPEEKVASIKKDFAFRKSDPTALESSEPPEELLTRDFNLEQRVPPPPPPISFEIPIHENGESIIKKHPPKRFRRLEENQLDSRDLTHEWIDEKQLEAEVRRKELLQLRKQSANHGTRRHNRRLVHSDAFNNDSEEGETTGQNY